MGRKHTRTLLLTIRLITQSAVVNLCTQDHFQIVLVDISNRKGEPRFRIARNKQVSTSTKATLIRSKVKAVLPGSGLIGTQACRQFVRVLGSSGSIFSYGLNITNAQKRSTPMEKNLTHKKLPAVKAVQLRDIRTWLVRP